MIQKGSTEYVDKGKLQEWIKSTRRAVYLPVIRSNGYDGLIAFDFADPSVPVGDRKSSTVTPQALYLMNSPLVHESSLVLVDRMLAATAEAGDDGRVEWLLRQLFGREARGGEVARVVSFVSSYAAAAGEDGRRKGWAAFVRALVASNEFLYIE